MAVVLLPPPEFDHVYRGPVIEQLMSAAEVARLCNGDVACTLFKPNFDGDKCFIVLPQTGPGGVSALYQVLLRRHEIGHCNGWSNKHEGGI